MTHNAQPTVNGPHNCEAWLTVNHGSLTSGHWQEGNYLVCGCGRAYVHVCDEAEGCAWWPK